MELVWSDLAACPPELFAGLDAVVRALLVDVSGGGRVVCAVDDRGSVVGAGGFELSGPGRAHAAVAVQRVWRHQGLGSTLAHLVVAAAQAAGVRYLSCRCGRAAQEAAQTATLFDLPCVSTVQVAFEQIVVLDVARLDHR